MGCGTKRCENAGLERGGVDRTSSALANKYINSEVDNQVGDTGGGGERRREGRPVVF